MATKSTKRKKPTKKPAPPRKPSRRSGGGSGGGSRGGSGGADGIDKLSRAIFRPEVAGVLLVLLAVFGEWARGTRT